MFVNIKHREGGRQFDLNKRIYGDFVGVRISAPPLLTLCGAFLSSCVDGVRPVLVNLLVLRLHFLPAYSPDHNRIERFWQDLHANVTRNHRHATLEALCHAVAAWLDAASPWPSSKRVAES